MLGNGAGGFRVQEDSLVEGGFQYAATAVAIARFNADPYGDLLATRPTSDPGGGADTDGTARVFLADDDGRFSSTFLDGPWSTGLGPHAVAVGDFDEDGRPDVAVANSGTAANTVSILLNITPWPRTELIGEVLEFGDREVNTLSPPDTVTVQNTGSDHLRIASATLGGDHPDDFVKTTDGCTGASVPPGGQCSIRLRFSPSATGERTASLLLVDNTLDESTMARFSGVGTEPTGGTEGPIGETGPAGCERRGGCDRGDRARGRDRCGRPSRPSRPVRCGRCERTAGSRRPAGSPRPQRQGQVQAEEVGVRQGQGDLHRALRGDRRPVARARPAHARKPGLRDGQAHRAPRPRLNPGAPTRAAALRPLHAPAHLHRRARRDGHARAEGAALTTKPSGPCDGDGSDGTRARATREGSSGRW